MPARRSTGITRSTIAMYIANSPHLRIMLTIIPTPPWWYLASRICESSASTVMTTTPRMIIYINASTSKNSNRADDRDRCSPRRGSERC